MNAPGERDAADALLAGGRGAGVLVWGPLLAMLSLLLVPADQPFGVALLACAVVVAGVLCAVLHLGLPEARRRW